MECGGFLTLGDDKASYDFGNCGIDGNFVCNCFKSMVTILFHETVFGPIHSRRLGTSLGINLMPNDGKICSFDCLYCEAGYNSQGAGNAGISSREEVRDCLEEKLSAMKASGDRLDVITFSGNGEPTLHPDFGGVVDDVIALRDKYYPDVKISVLSNSTMIGRKAVADALKKVDNNILKLDSAIDSTVRLIDRPANPDFCVKRVVESLKQFSGQCIIQTMMLRGSHTGERIDNTTDEEIEALLSAYLEIQPLEVMLYSIDRPTPEADLHKVELDELNRIAMRFREKGIKVQVN